jgi:peptidoglycan biosynthesis protein MviN/MurJ (putative lipid II flippase)
MLALLRRGMLITVATLFSRPLGYVRVAMQAGLFGATAAMDAFGLAFSVSSRLQVILLTGPLSGVLVPTLTAYRHNRQALHKLFNSLFTLCLLAGVMVAGLAAWGVPLLMHLAGPGLALETHAMATLLFRLMLPILVLQALLSVCKGAFNVVPLSTVLLTDLADLYHRGDIVQVHRRTLSALRLVLLLTIPVTIGGVLLAESLTRLAYEYGRFRVADTLLTSQALRAYLTSLPFYGTAHLLNRCFYAIHDTMTPAMVSRGALSLHIIADAIFMQFFSHWGIALATTVVLLATTAALYVLFQRRCTRLERR